MTPKRRLSQWCVNSLPEVLLQSQQLKYDKHARLNNSTFEGMVNKCLSSSVQIVSIYF